MPPSGSYLDRDGFAARTIAPTSLVTGDFIDPTGQFTDPVKIAKRAAWQTFVDSQLVIESSRINARLRKRYLVPFADPCPEIVAGWLAAVVTPKLYERRGWDPSDAQAQSILADAERVLDEQKEAADSEEGLFDLPLRQDSSTSALGVVGGPFGYSENSPYVWSDAQRDAADVEDRR
jgi:hypothetical protein